MSAQFLRNRVGDELERVGGARVLGDGLVVQVDDPGDRVKRHILEYRAEPPGAGVNLRFCCGRKLYHFCVAAPLEIENPFVAPSMLVVADQAPLRVRRERGLACPRQPEENRRIAAAPDIGRAVHRHDPVKGEKVVEDCEDRFLDFPGIGGVTDDAYPCSKIQDDERVRGGAVDLGYPFERGDAQDRKVGDVAAVFLPRLGQDEHVPGEMAVPRQLRDNADRHPVGRIGTGVTVLHEHIAALEESLYPVVEIVELLGAERTVVLSPPDLSFGARLPHDELVGGGAGGVPPRICHDRTHARDARLPAECNFLVERLGREIPVGKVKVREPMIVEPVITLQRLRLPLCGGLHVQYVVHSQSRTNLRSPI